MAQSNQGLAADSQQKLLEAAFSVIAEKGLEGLRTRDIVARAGVNISTLHYHFKTKEKLLAAVVDYVRRVFTAAEQEDGDFSGSAREALQAYFSAAWRRFQMEPGLVTVLQELMLRAKRDSSTRTLLREIHDYWTGRVEAILRRGVESGELRADLNPRAGAEIITSVAMGVAMRMNVLPRAFDFGRVSKELDQWLRPIRR
jgi:AcrR family transcriptional regulator